MRWTFPSTSACFPAPRSRSAVLRVDETDGAVRTADGGTVPGLYAAGRAAVGIASNHYVSGLALADCIWSGRRAGRSAAATRMQREKNVKAMA